MSGESIGLQPQLAREPSSGTNGAERQRRKGGSGKAARGRRLIGRECRGQIRVSVRAQW
jgi:hypothetical protein